MFQSWLYVLNGISDERYEKLLAKKEAVLKAYEDFCLSGDYFNVMRSKDKSSASSRNEKFDKIVLVAINEENHNDNKNTP